MLYPAVFCFLFFCALALAADEEDRQDCPVGTEGCPGEERKIADEDALRAADKAFAQCCKLEKRVPEACYPLCSYGGLTAESMIDVFMAKECPLKAGSTILLCASAYKDHTECCQKHGVGEDEATEDCLTFCNPAAGIPMMEPMEAYQCVAKFTEIKNCFIEKLLPSLGEKRKYESEQKEKNEDIENEEKQE